MRAQRRVSTQTSEVLKGRTEMTKQKGIERELHAEERAWSNAQWPEAFQGRTLQAGRTTRLGVCLWTAPYSVMTFRYILQKSLPSSSSGLSLRLHLESLEHGLEQLHREMIGQSRHGSWEL